MVSDMFNKVPPTDPLERAHAFARDLAYGVAIDFWSTEYYSIRGTSRFYTLPLLGPGEADQLEIMVANKWNDDPPHPSLLLSLGYLHHLGRTERNNDHYLLTDQALQLLHKPATEPDIFISYRRRESSAFALLIEARLRLAGNPNPFVDKNIPGGEDWHGLLKERIQSAEYFIILVGPTTLDSEWVQKEIAWAVEAECKLVALCHNGMTLMNCPPTLTSKQGYEVKAESALEYEAAANFVLNSLGYATY